MGIVVMLVTLVILGFIYRRMIARDVPEPIGRKQALVPVWLGVAAVPLSLVFTYGLEPLAVDFAADNHSMIMQSVLSGFFNAGLTEEIAKFLMIAAALKIFRNNLKNVYEYILTGAAVGYGFTVPEELLYLFNPAGLLFRMIVIAGHLVYGVIMAYFLGIARYKIITNQGSPTKEYILAFFVPVLLHTLYDACTGFNVLLDNADEDVQLIGLCIGLAGILVWPIIQIMVLRKVKKNAGNLCSLRLLPEAPPPAAF